MKIIFTLLLSLLLTPIAVNATESSMGESLNLLLTPEKPGANQIVEARLESFSTNLDRAEISWLLDGKIALTGTGAVKFSFKTGPLGSETSLGVNIKSFDGIFLNQSIKIRPAEISLVWQAYSYTPPFYKGKALLPIQGTASIIAFPSFITTENKTIPPEKIIYTWSENGRVSGDGSGYGKFSFAVKGRIPIRPITVAVEATAPDFGLIASAETVINPVVPQIVLYEDTPLLGKSIKKAVQNGFNLTKEEMRIYSVPFYFETPTRTGNGLAYEWNIGGIESTEKGPDITVRRSGDAIGTAQILLSVTSPASIFQAAETIATIIISAMPFGTQ